MLLGNQPSNTTLDLASRSHWNELTIKFKGERFYHTSHGSTLNGPITMGHGDFLKPMLFLIMRISVGYINFQSMLNSSRNLATIKFPRKLMQEIILFCATFVLQIILNVLVGSWKSL